MKGIYVYGIIGQTKIPKIESEGVDFGNGIEIFRHQDLWVVISYVEPYALSKAEIERKLNTDVAWTKRNVEAHHQVVMELARQGTVIPLRFATIFKSINNLERMLKDYYPQFNKLLLELKSRQEMGVKVYLNYEQAKNTLELNDLEVAQLGSNIRSAAPGRQWYLEKKEQYLVKEKIEVMVEEKLKKILKRLDDHSDKSILNRPLPLVMEESPGEMILNGAFLIKGSQLKSFQKLSRDLNVELQEEGFSLEVTGPWPPYNFVNIRS